MIKLQDFAKQMGVTERAIQKHIRKYSVELEGTYERKGPNGTWLSDEACDILRTKMKQAPVVMMSDPSEREAALQAENEALRAKLFEVQQQYTDYVSSTTKTLQKASSQIALAERAGEYKERADSLKVENGLLSADRDKWKDKATEADNAAQKASEELLREQTRPITLAEWWQRRKNKE